MILRAVIELEHENQILGRSEAAPHQEAARLSKMFLIKSKMVTLEWNGGLAQIDDGEPSAFLYETNGRVIAFGDNGARSLVGRFRLYYVNVEAAVDDGTSVFEVFDTHAHTLEFHQAIFGSSDWEFSERLVRLIDCESLASNVLILDRIELLPSFRGKGLGLVLMRALIERFSAGSGVIAIKPFPLQFEVSSDDSAWRAKLRLTSFPSDNRIATGKLTSYYGRLGFLRMKRTPFMFKATNTVLPRIAELSH